MQFPVLYKQARGRGLGKQRSRYHDVPLAVTDTIDVKPQADG